MKEKLKKVLLHISKFTEEELEQIAGCFKARKAGKNEIILAEGQTCKDFYFVASGSIRTYFITRQGSEKTRYVMLDLFIGTALSSFIQQKPSYEAMEALEDSELLTISHSDFYRLVATMPAWNTFYLKILEMAYTFQNNKIELISTLSAKERYMHLLKNSPQLIQRLSNKILASYLDIRQETLSRIKSK